MDIMIDIETMSSRPNAAVASLGAVAFNAFTTQAVTTIPPSQLFYARLDLRAQQGRHFDGDTIYWWLQQEEAAREALLVREPLDPKDHLNRFVAWVNENYGHLDKVWCFGATFDHVILRDLFRFFDIEYPFHYRLEFCARTITRIADLRCPDLPDLVGHNAVDDALRQAIWLQQCLAKLRAGARV